MAEFEYTWAEIARALGINEATVRDYCDRGTKKYRRNWLRMFGIDSKPTFELRDCDKFKGITDQSQGG